MSNKRKYTGRITIRIDGQEYASNDGATLDPGGVVRNPVKGGGRVHGFSEQDEEPKATASFPDHPDLSIKALDALTDATITFDTDTGKQYVIRGGYTVTPSKLNGTNIDTSWSGIDCDEISG